MAFDLDPNYKQVPERIADFKEKHPDGCLRPVDPQRPYWIEKIGDDTFIVYAAAAYRSETDPLPGIGLAMERFPGRTPYTKDSELQNAETSAWGRAIVAALASESKAVASAEDVRNRQADMHAPDPVDASPAPNSKEHGELLARIATIKQSDAAAAALRELWTEPDEHGNPTLPPSSKLRLRHMATAWALVESVEARMEAGEFTGQPALAEPEVRDPVAQTLDEYESERVEARARHDAEIARLNTEREPQEAKDYGTIKLGGGAEREPEASSWHEAKALAKQLNTGDADEVDPFEAAGLAHPEQFRTLEAIVAYVSVLDDKTELRLRLDDLGVKWAGGHNLDSLRKMLAESYADRDGLR